MLVEEEQPPKLTSHLTLSLTVGVAFAIAVTFFVIAWSSDSAISRRERLQLIEMTNGFTEVFSEVRGAHAPIPAEFRRMGVQRFSAEDGSTPGAPITRFRVPGLPGLELGARSDNEHIQQIITGFTQPGQAQAHHENRIEGGEVVGRTLVSSIAHSEGCVTCHNEMLGRQAYEIGDVMGAFVVENNMTNELLNDLQYAAFLFIASFLALWWIIMREKKHNRRALRLESNIARARMRTEAAQLEQFLLSHDPLTDLPNRKLFNDHLNALCKAGVEDTVYTALVDLDDFKAVNDTMGHHVGDALLCEIASRLRDYVSSVDGFAARLGGDEFVLVWQQSEAEDACDRFASGLLETLTQPFKTSQWQITPKASLGVVSCIAARPETPSDLLKAADAALYVAKSRGKNTYQIYNEETDRALRRQNDLSVQLPLAIANGDLRVVFQPKVHLENGTFAGFEALSRWRLNGEDVPPDEFVPLAEATGVVQDLDSHVLAEAVKFAASLGAETGRAIPVAVNFSAYTLCHSTILETAQHALQHFGLPPDLLTIEITETAAIENWTKVQTVIAQLRAIGIRMALDDFGTGFSSLAYLLRMRFDEIKIDREFVRDVKQKNDSYTLLKHIADMAKSLDLSMVIEGIETEDQAALLADVGQDMVGQGFLFSHPLERDAARDFILGSRAKKWA